MRLFIPAVAVALLAGCTAPAPEPTEQPDTLTGTVTVFAAASLTETFDALAARVRGAAPRRRRGAELRRQLGARHPDHRGRARRRVRRRQRVDHDRPSSTPATPPTRPSSRRNTLELVVPAGNPAGVDRARRPRRPVDLAIALCDPAVPCGSAAQTLLELRRAHRRTRHPRGGREGGADQGRARRGRRRTGLRHRRASRAGDAVEGIEFPRRRRSINMYPIARADRRPEPGCRAGLGRLRPVARRASRLSPTPGSWHPDRMSRGARGARLSAPVAHPRRIGARVPRAAAGRARDPRPVGRPAAPAHERAGAAGARAVAAHRPHRDARSASCSACPLAVLLSHSAEWPLVPRRLLRAAITVPLVLPPVVGGIALLLLLGRRGIIGQFFADAGLGIPYTTGAVVLAQTFVAMPFLVFAVEGALGAADRRTEAAAATLGAEPLAGVPAGDRAAGRAGHRGRRGALLHPRARRVRRDDHVRRVAAGRHAHAADRQLPGAADRSARPRSRSPCCCSSSRSRCCSPLRDRWLPGVRA